MEQKMLIRDGIGWGFLVWLFGYVLSFVLFFVVPPALLGWVLMPFGIAFTVWVLWKYVSIATLPEQMSIGCVWTLLAVAFDYIGIVQLLHPADGYYKLDVYLYYTLTFALPFVVGAIKNKQL